MQSTLNIQIVYRFGLLKENPRYTLSLLPHTCSFVVAVWRGLNVESDSKRGQILLLDSEMNQFAKDPEGRQTTGNLNPTEFKVTELT